MINITCQCEYTADYLDFCRTLIGGDLPPGHFQCPKCHRAWKRKESEYRILRAGSESMIIPGKVELVEVSSRF